LTYVICSQHFETVAALINSYLTVNKNTLQRRQQLQKTINARDQQGRTAVLMAATHGATSVIALLLEHGADLTIKNNANESVLDVAKKNYEHANNNDMKAQLSACIELLEDKWRNLESQSQALAEVLLLDELSAKSSSKNRDVPKKKKKKGNISQPNKTEQTRPITDTNPAVQDKATKNANIESTAQFEPQVKSTRTKSNEITTTQIHNTNNTQQKPPTNDANTSLRQPISYASIVSKNLPARVDTPSLTPSKLNNTGFTPKRTRKQRHYDTDNDEDVQELLRKAQAYDFLQQSLESMHAQAGQLGLECEHMFGLNLSSLSMSQLSALEELHFDALKQLSEAKVDYVRDLEQMRQEERLTLERMIMQLTKQLHENNEWS